ncbi:hypothetical protein SBF1_2300005 [Candidatus Desulfosporosinus infrequens]|uniref:Uncharacterized protein n=1 Tax=Candidatus Desulfosporosinus infrequens TaxID=2043169 RepID=A0A2U3KLN9_9FIRM|nr:hypothetical protein SBF1_2300005 [Candidatus Desulfosporosinus infrequens]
MFDVSFRNMCSYCPEASSHKEIIINFAIGVAYGGDISV